MFLLLIVIIFLLIPFVIRQDKLRKAAFAERKRQRMAIGSEWDEDEDDEAEHPTATSQPAVSLTRQKLNPDSNPYRPPQEN